MILCSGTVPIEKNAATILAMTFMQTFRQRVALRCDATPSSGVGHVVRCLALGQELIARGADVTLWGRIDGLDWLATLVDESHLSLLPAASDVGGQLQQAAAADFAAVVLDGYGLPPALGNALRGAGYVVAALVDGDFGAAQEADLYVDQNLGAHPHRGGPLGSSCLTGADYILLRDSVLSRRRQPGPSGGIRSVLAVFGGSDPAGAAPVVVPTLLATGAGVDVTVVSSNPASVARLAALRRSPQQRLRVIPPQPDLAGLATASDLVISASGTTVWELLAIGVPAAVVCVVDNQRLGYRALVAADVVTALGELTTFDDAAATESLRRVLEYPARATQLAARGQLLIDGEGRRRVADALLRMLRERSP